MPSGYSYVNENGRVVGGRAADNHWMTEHGYKRVENLIDDVARKVASEIKGELDSAAMQRKKITHTKHFA